MAVTQPAMAKDLNSLRKKMCGDDENQRWTAIFLILQETGTDARVSNKEGDKNEWEKKAVPTPLYKTKVSICSREYKKASFVTFILTLKDVDLGPATGTLPLSKQQKCVPNALVVGMTISEGKEYLSQGKTNQTAPHSCPRMKKKWNIITSFTPKLRDFVEGHSAWREI